MKTTVIPAQITTVEDTIAGGLSLSQLLLLMIPLLVFSVLYVALPPFMQLSSLKLLLVGATTVVACCLAIRIAGVLVLHQLLIRLRYARRAHCYVFDKNDGYLRTPRVVEVMKDEVMSEPVYPTSDLVLEKFIAAAPIDAAFRLNITKRGGIRATIQPSDTKSNL